MQPKSTQSILWSFFRKIVAIVVIFFSVTSSSFAQTDLFNEGFAAVPVPGWAEQNLSSSIGAFPTWVQGLNNLFPSHSGGPDDYILGNYQNLGATGTIISNWLFCPSVILTNGDVFSFWTRTVDAPAFPDRLQVRLSTNGSSVDVGTTDVSVGDFSTVLLDINPTYDVNGYPNVWTLQTVTISGLAAPIQGRIAFRYFVEDGGPNGLNSDNVGIDDVIYFQTVTPPCSGAPVLGNTIATFASVCPGTPVSLSAQNAVNGSGITYQWQSSDAQAGPYADIAGATSPAYQTTITADTWFQLVAICAGSPGTSTPVLVTLTPPSGCYCLVQDDCSFDDFISNILIGGIDNTSDCSASGYTDYTTTVAAGEVISNAINPISVTVGPGGNEVVTTWIDYDHSGTFESSEYAVIGSGNGATITGGIDIPASALNGVTRMRVRVRYNAATAAGNACVDNIFGETEDYNVNITPCIPGVFASSPTDVSTSCGQNVTFTATANGSILQYQWQEKGASGLWTDLDNGPNVSGATTNSVTLSGVLESMNGYQYRVLISGGCTSTDFSAAATLTVTPLVIEVSPADYATCSPIPAGSPIALEIITQNGVSTTTTVSFPSTFTTPVTIPDGDFAGIIDAVTVSGIPAGATITGAAVKLNIAHTWAGDLAIALKAPNGNVLNLDYGLTQTGGAGATTGFTNTIISSAGTATLVSGSNPWTGIFAPDAPTAPGGVPTAPTNLSPVNANVFTFPDLYSVPNGAWTIGLLDYSPPDEGTFINWELQLTYTFSVTTPYTGVWSPATGLFTDPAGQVPYNGTDEVTTLYAAPTATTVYTVTVTDADCPPAPVLVPVRILSPDPAVSLAAAPYTNLYPGLQTNITSTINPAPGANNQQTYQWYLNGEAIAGATGTSYIANVDGVYGTYTFELTDPTICSGRVAAEIMLKDSVKSQLFIYPNPNTGVFQVRYDDGINDLLGKPRILTIYDSKGARVFSQTYYVNVPYGRMDVDLSRQPKGVYIVDLTDVTGRRLNSERVIIY